MNLLRRVYLILIFYVPLEGITVPVKPARCPTNKIAPHKRSTYYGQVGGRAFGGAFYDLLSPGGLQQDQLSPMPEQPQEDESDDCGDIEDYDETDLSSISQQGHNDNRFFFGPWQRPGQSTTYMPPTRPTVTYMPTSQYWSGGYFGNNHYRPPLQEDPSDQVKPVHDGAHESHSTYRPDIVGGPVGHVVGHNPVQLTTKPPSYYEYTTQKRPHHHTRYPTRITQATVHTTRPSRPRMYNNDGILGSFVDLLLFK